MTRQLGAIVAHHHAILMLAQHANDLILGKRPRRIARLHLTSYLTNGMISGEQVRWRMMAYMAAIFFVTMAAAALLVDLGFQPTGFVPDRAVDIRARMTEFSFNYTLWLNLVALALAAYLFVQNRRSPMNHNAHHRTGSAAA